VILFLLLATELLELTLDEFPLRPFSRIHMEFLARFHESGQAQIQIVMIHGGQEMVQSVGAEICEGQEDRIVDHFAIAHRVHLEQAPIKILSCKIR